MSDDPDDDIEFLAASSVRVDLLGQLVAGARRPADLVAETDVSRTTVHRTLTGLCERDWVRRTDRGYVATAAGELVLETYRETRERFRTVERFAPFVNPVDGELEFELDRLRDARVETATGENPQRPIEWYADRLEAVDGDRLRGTTPIVSRQIMAVHAPVVLDGTPTELVVDEATFRRVGERYPDRLRESLALESYDLFVADEVPSVGIARYGDVALLNAYDDERRLVACVESDDPQLCERVETVYRRHRASARSVSSDAVPVSD